MIKRRKRGAVLHPESIKKEAAGGARMLVWVKLKIGRTAASAAWVKPAQPPSPLPSETAAKEYLM